MRIQSGKFEREDSEGQKYLNYKSISGMDCVPRLRQPTPPKAKNAREELEQALSDNDCKKCHKYNDRVNELVEENDDLKNELKKLKSDMDKMRLLNKAMNI